ncbi:MAG: hypothetical protein ACKV22_14915 [Bryobacteraceae bacterium]
MVTVKYPHTNNSSGGVVTGPTYAYSFDAIARPSGLAENVTQPMVQSVVYKAASKITRSSTCNTPEGTTGTGLSRIFQREHPASAPMMGTTRKLGDVKQVLPRHRLPDGRGTDGAGHREW